ncbi:uncharacterized protein LOC131858338 [Cryptomeria japonica]|uniref:uncharacterized protein LOC131858338 n=1 Tax=Cryptomeria japonica TaxID=3369 RepID=UPI0027DA4B02|nr:uncharacterized protein LOC131858338 [Cryptomeria japonica]
MVNPKKSKLVPTPPKQAKPRQSQSAPTFNAQKPIAPSKSQTTTSFDGAEKRKKEKHQRVYVVSTTEDIETESDEAVKEIYEVTKETETILKQFLIDKIIDVNLKEPSQDTSISDVHAVVPDKKKDQSSVKETPEEQPKVHTRVDDDNANVDISGEAVQDPPKIEEKVVDETIDVDKDKDDGEEGEKDENAEIAEKEKGEKETDQAPPKVILIFGIVVKGGESKVKNGANSQWELVYSCIIIISMTEVSPNKKDEIQEAGPTSSFSTFFSYF